MCGGGAVRGSGGRLNSAGGFPIRIATACSYCARSDAHIDRCCAGSLQLSLCLLNFHFGSNPSFETALIQFQSLLVLLDRGIQELFLGVEAAGLKVIDGQIRVHAQIDRSQVCRTRLRLFSIGLHGFSNSAPDVSLVGNVEWQHKVVVGDAIARSNSVGAFADTRVRVADGPAVTVG